jgi:hypothetical protein
MHHVDSVIADGRRRFERTDADAPAFNEHALRDLVRRQERLARLHARIESAAYSERAGLWQRFFLCYDDFVMALQTAPLRARTGAPARGVDQASSSS